MKNSSYEKQMNPLKKLFVCVQKSHLELLNSERLLASEKNFFKNMLIMKQKIMN